MKLHNVLVVYGKELKDAVRDRRTLISTVLIPTVMMPLMIFGLLRIMSKVMSSAHEDKPLVSIVAGGDSPQLVAALRASDRFRFAPPADDADPQRREEALERQIAEKKIRAAVLIPPGFEEKLRADAAPAIEILHYEGELKSKFAADGLEKFFRDFRDRHVAETLASHGLPATLMKPFDITRRNVAPPEKVGGNLAGGVVPYLIILLCFTGAMYPAIDATAGEKERGTMETLLCSPARRVEIVLGKFLLVLTGSLSAVLLSLASMAITGTATGMIFPRGGLASAAAASGAPLPTIDPMGIFGVLAMVLPVAVLFSALQLTVALFARSTKEAQSYIGPMIFFVLAPAIIGMLPGIDLNARLALVPLLNLSLVCKEMLSGVWHWHYIALIFGSTCVYAAVALGLAVKMFNRESVLFRT